MSKIHPSRQSNGENTRSLLAQVLHQFRSAFIGVGLFSALINLLMLSGSMFMLQVYDRVLPSKSVPTLIGLSFIFLGLYAFQAILDLIRTRVLVRIGSAFDESLSERVFGAVIKLPLRGARAADALQPVRDLDTVRTFLTGLGPTALFDLPWMPLYLALCFAFNFYIGLAATVGAIVIVTLTVIIEITSRGPIRDVAKFSAARSVFAESSRAHSEVLHALGMTGRMGARWREANTQYSDAQQRVSDVTGGLGSIAKVLRLILQSAVLGVGAYLVIQNEATAGIIIASSIITARALAPVDIAIANWKAFGAARQSWQPAQWVACGPSGRARRPSAAEAIGQFVGREHCRGAARLEEDGGAGHQLQSRSWVSTRNCRPEWFRQVLAGEGFAGRVAGFLRDRAHRRRRAQPMVPRFAWTSSGLSSPGRVALRRNRGREYLSVRNRSLARRDYCRGEGGRRARAHSGSAQRVRNRDR